MSPVAHENHKTWEYLTPLYHLEIITGLQGLMYQEEWSLASLFCKFCLGSFTDHAYPSLLCPLSFC